jgi:rod shape determining protein RodA
MVLSVGALKGGARLSFDFGPIAFQPAEFAKPAVLVALAAYFSESRDEVMSYSKFIGGLVIVGIPTALIIVQPDLGSAFVLIVGALCILVMAGARLRYLALISFLTIVTVAAAVVKTAPTPRACPSTQCAPHVAPAAAAVSTKEPEAM